MARLGCQLKPLLRALLLLFFSCAVHANEELDTLFQRDRLVIINSERTCLLFDIYLAVNIDQQRRGLMFVRDLPEMTGMLFVYEEADYRSMWMKNTFISLDIIFARSDGTITNIVKSTEPRSLKSLGSTEPVSYVLELNAGVTDKYDINTESRLEWGGMQSDDE